MTTCRQNPWGLPDQCEYCDLHYEDFRTGLIFQDVVDMMWSGSSDPKDWRYKRRNSVLGYWRQIKIEEWRNHLENCAQEAEWTESDHTEDSWDEDDFEY